MASLPQRWRPFSQPVTDNTSMYLTRVVSKRIFAPGASRKGVSENVSNLQRRGSASRSHGMSFTEMKLPADQVISLHTQKTVMETASKEELLADEQEREKTVADQVCVPPPTPAAMSSCSHAVLTGPASLLSTSPAADAVRRCFWRTGMRPSLAGCPR